MTAMRPTADTWTRSFIVAAQGADRTETERFKRPASLRTSAVGLSRAGIKRGVGDGVLVGALGVDDKHRLLELKGGEIVRRGVGFVDVKAVVVHVDRDAILAAAGVHDVELTAWDARRVVLGELIADLAALTVRHHRILDDGVVDRRPIGEIGDGDGEFVPAPFDIE